jgi:hypothetical protein
MIVGAHRLDEEMLREGFQNAGSRCGAVVLVN